MPNRPSSHSKNHLDLQIDLGFSYRRWWILLGVVACFSILLLAANLSWWHWLVWLLVCVGLMAWWAMERRIVSLGTQSIDELWQIESVLFAQPKQLWQGYLVKVWHADLGVAQVIGLQFFIILPKKRSMTVLIFDDMLPKNKFAKLVVLSKFSPSQYR